MVVIYHSECTDGFSAAWAAWKKFGDKADYIGVNPGVAPIDGLQNKEIYMVDLIYPIEYINKLISLNKKFVAIDHHVSNLESFGLVKEGLFDIKNSGSVLAWRYFHPKIKTPKLLKHVEDMDLWKFKISGTREVIAYLDTVDFDFKKWDEIVKGAEDKPKFNEYVHKGEVILKYQDQVIENIIVNHSVLVNFFGHKAYAVNSPVFNSQIANILYKKLPPVGIVWIQETDGGAHVSLRSDGTVDVSKLATKFKGGGGHKQSAGFSVENISKLPWEIIRS